MFKKILMSLSLILAIVIAPVAFVGCNKTVIKSATGHPDDLVGLYIFDTINLKINGVNALIRDISTDEEIANKPDGWTVVDQETLHGNKWFDIKVLFQLVKEESGVYLNKDGTIDFNIEESSTIKPEGEIDLYEYKDMLTDRTWFSSGDTIYVTGNFSIESQKNEDVHVFDNSVCICFEIVGKNLRTQITIKYGPLDEETQEYTLEEDYTFILHRANY